MGKKRGSKLGVKRGPYKKRKPRRYPGPHKTTTRAGKNEYMRRYMRERKNILPSRFGARGPIPKRILASQVIGSIRKPLLPWRTRADKRRRR